MLHHFKGKDLLKLADVIYGNTWHSMATENKEQRLVDFAPYQVNMRVIESEHCVFWDQGENRMHTEKAVPAVATL